MKLSTVLNIAAALVMVDAIALPWDPDKRCNWEGEGCWKEIKVREASDKRCNWEGEGCWKEIRAREPSNEKCNWEGEGCWKMKRAGEVFTAAVRSIADPAAFSTTEARAISELASVVARGQDDSELFLRDLVPTENTGKAKRVAGALISALEHLDSREVVVPEGVQKRDLDDLDARCYAADGPCTQAQRGLDSMKVAARHLVESL